MKRSASNILLLLVIALIIVVVIVFAWDKQMAPDYTDVMGNVTQSDGQELPAGAAGIVLSEIMVENDMAVRDEDGEYPRWVELYNSTDAEISLSGYALSDREDDATKYPLPAVKMQPHEYRVVFLSGKNRTEIAGQLHTSFKVNSEETLYLFSGNAIVDSVSGSSTMSNMSRIKHGASAWEETALYSPGFENTESGHNAYIAQFDKRAVSVLKINEVQSSNATCLKDEQGLYPDWIEIINTGSEIIDLTGYGLSDDVDKPMRWVFPKGSIAPGEVIVVFADGTNNLSSDIPHTNFSISSGGEVISLYDPDGGLLDRVSVPEMVTDSSYARDPSGIGDFTVQGSPTPQMVNTLESQTELSNRFFQENNRGVYISEVMTSNNEALLVGSFSPDWVEITNGTGSAVNLSNYALTNKPGATARYIFPDTTLESGQSTLIYLTDDKTLLGEGYEALTATFKGSSTGEMLYLYDADRVCVDKLSVPALSADISFGRDANRTGLFYFAKSTPGKTNDTAGYYGVCDEPTFSHDGGTTGGSVTLTINVPEGATVYYSTDCSTPNTSDNVYTGPISIDKNTVIRAYAVRDGYLDSTTATRTYITEDTHTVRVVSLVTDDKYLFAHETGLYANGPGWQETFPHGYKNHGANFWMDWEYPMHVEVWDEDGTKMVQQDGSFRLNGQYSRALDQKSIAVYARSSWGGHDNNPDRFYSALFDEREYTDYKAFVMRSTAQDYNRARMRDAMMTGLIKDQGVMYQETEVCVLYLNGKYWGHYNMRERVNKWSVAQWEGITDEAIIDNIDILKGNGKSANQTLNGSNKEYRELIEYVRNHDLRNEENLKYVTDRVDVVNYFDYQIAEMFWVNSDNGNIKFYKVPGGKWKWILFDLDWGINTGEDNGYKRDGFLHVLNPNGTGYNDSFENDLIRALLKNPDMEELFLERCAYYLTEVYTAEAINAEIDQYVEIMAPEMEKHYERWPDHGSVSGWERHVGRLRTFADERTAYMVKHMQDWFNLTDSEMRDLVGDLFTE